MFPHPRDPTFWRYIAQAFMGLFFCAAAYYKLTDSFFGLSEVPLNVVFDFWIKQGYPIGFYKSLMQMAMPYVAYLSGLVILMQGAFGIMMLYNVAKRTAAIILLVVQLNIFLGTFHHTGFNVFVGISLWVALYYLFQKDIEKRRWIWGLLTLLLVSCDLLHLWIRYKVGDPWIAAYSWQRLHFSQNVMSISPFIKHAFLWLSQGTIGMYIWASMWWLHVVLALGLLTRWRLQGGVALVLYFYFRAIIWTNVVGSDGVLWTLVLFVFITEEEYRQRTQGGRYSFIPFFNRASGSAKVVVKAEKKKTPVEKPAKKMDALAEIDTAPEPIS
ncbi:MAG: hypothetical protein KBD00_05135 [Candidatus Peribacteraceae bacterium]|nr:hypothetical protein [Candidatus Peribacteraceae bacterium]